MTADTTQNTDNTVTAIEDVVQTLSTGSGSAWTCGTCQVTFDDQQAQRQHMKCSWHVYNLKRKIADLPSISEDVFNAHVQPQSSIDEIEPGVPAEKAAMYDEASPFHCLFCHASFEQGADRLNDNIEHMYSAHGFILPDRDSVLDLESILSYLSTMVREWHECLYCGTLKDTTVAVQSHMRDKDHCKLNIEREPELLEFWEAREEAQPTLAPAEMLALPIHSADRPYRGRLRGFGRSEASAVAVRTSRPQDSSRYQLARRDELGLQNIAPQQRQALVLATKRAQKEQAIALRASEWSYARKANKQKHDQAHGPLSWAKGGLHNLLPR